MELQQQPRLFSDFDLKFPPLSRTVAEVSDLLGANGMPDTDRLINIVHMDPLVVASVLKRINSAFYGMRQQFHDIRKAILMIGFIEVCNIVLASGYIRLKKDIKTHTYSQIIDRIMRVSIGTGFYANLLSQHLRLPDKSSAFTAGLLHNVGRFVLLYNVPDAYEQLFTKRKIAYLPSHEEEIESFGIDHSSIGALAAQHWNFPELITSLIESYQKPGQLQNTDHKTIALILSASSSIAQQLCTTSEDLEKHAEEVDEEAEAGESRFSHISFPVSIEYPKTLHQVAKRKNLNVAELRGLVGGHQQEALEYIEMMISI